MASPAPAIVFSSVFSLMVGTISTEMSPSGEMRGLTESSMP